MLKWQGHIEPLKPKGPASVGMLITISTAINALKDGKAVRMETIPSGILRTFDIIRNILQQPRTSSQSYYISIYIYFHIQVQLFITGFNSILHKALQW